MRAFNLMFTMSYKMKLVNVINLFETTFDSFLFSNILHTIRLSIKAIHFFRSQYDFLAVFRPVKSCLISIILQIVTNNNYLFSVEACQNFEMFD